MRNIIDLSLRVVSAAQMRKLVQLPQSFATDSLGWTLYHLRHSVSEGTALLLRIVSIYFYICFRR
jgi:hypothetical protein